MRIGYTVIPVLRELYGKPWNEITKAFLRALRPSEIQTVHGVVKNDAVHWRVTVYLTPDDVIDRIEQEVEVDLPDGAQHGYDLLCRLEKL